MRVPAGSPHEGKHTENLRVDRAGGSASRRSARLRRAPPRLRCASRRTEVPPLRGGYRRLRRQKPLRGAEARLTAPKSRSAAGERGSAGGEVRRHASEPAADDTANTPPALGIRATARKTRLRRDAPPGAGTRLRREGKPLRDGDGSAVPRPFGRGAVWLTTRRRRARTPQAAIPGQPSQAAPQVRRPTMRSHPRPPPRRQHPRPSPRTSPGAPGPTPGRQRPRADAQAAHSGSALKQGPQTALKLRAAEAHASNQPHQRAEQRTPAPADPAAEFRDAHASSSQQRLRECPR